MSKAFFEKSKEVSNEYLQSIVFIDDKAYVNEASNDHEFNAEKITNEFAKSKKICAVYRPKVEEDIVSLIQLGKKSDVIVLDWQINLDKDVATVVGQGSEQDEKNDSDKEESEADVDDEEDVVDDDPRGEYTKRIIKGVLEDEEVGKNGLKLILIYTGEIDLRGITEDVFKEVESLSIGTVEKGDCSIKVNSVKILVVSKPSSNEEGAVDYRFQHTPELNDKIISYEKLPCFVLEEFTEMTNGLLSTFALKSLTEVRRNSSRLLSLFSKELDPAYLSHLSLLPNKEDGNELLVELIKDALGNLLLYRKLNSYIDDNLLGLWIEENIEEKEKSVLNEAGNETPEKYNRNKEFVKSIINISEVEAKKIKGKYKELMKVNSVGSYLKNNNITFFSDLDKETLRDVNNKFAVLTHHKSLYAPCVHNPTLSLGTVLKSNKDKLYVCIQQRCDSVRIGTDEERRFLFLSIDIVEGGKFNFVSAKGERLRVVDKSYSIRTIKFKGGDDGLVKAEKKGDKYVFKQKYNGADDEVFEWVFDLKDLHAQRIVDDYTSKLSRVGLDESEWLRRSNLN